MADNFNPNNLMGGFQQPTQGGYYQPNEEQGMIGSVLQGQITSVMRSFKDELSFNMQSLNLTLSNLTNSMNNLSGKIGELGPNTAGRYINSGINSGTFLGYQSREFANYQPLNHTSFLGGIINSDYVRHPFNVSPLEYYSGLDIKRGTYGAGFLGDIGASVIDKLPGIFEMGLALPFLAGGPITAGIGAAVGLGTHLISSGLRQGGGVYVDTARALRRMSGRFSSMPFTNRESLDAASQLQRLSYNELMGSGSGSVRLGYQGFKDVALLGLQGDLFQGNNTGDLIKQVSKTADVVKTFTGIMGLKNVKEAMEAIVQMKNMGVNPATMDQFLDYAKQLGNNAFGYGYMNSMSTSQMLRTGMQIAQSGYGTNGIPGAIGINQGMQSLAFTNELRKRGILTNADIAIGGGNVSMASRMLGLQAQVLNSGIGTAWTALAMQTGSADLATQVLDQRGITGLYGGAIGTMLSGDVFANMSKARMQRHNLLAKLSSGQIDNATGSMIMALLNQNYAFRGKGLEDQINIGGDILMNTFQGLDQGSALSVMNKLLRPELTTAMNFKNELVADAGRMSQDRYRYGLSSIWYNITNSIEKAIESHITQPITEFTENLTRGFSGMRSSYMDYTNIDTEAYLRSKAERDAQGKIKRNSIRYADIWKDYTRIPKSTFNFMNALSKEEQKETLELAYGNVYNETDMFDTSDKLSQGVDQTVYGTKSTFGRRGTIKTSALSLLENQIGSSRRRGYKLSGLLDILREARYSGMSDNEYIDWFIDNDTSIDEQDVKKLLRGGYYGAPSKFILEAARLKKSYFSGNGAIDLSEITDKDIESLNPYTSDNSTLGNVADVLIKSPGAIGVGGILKATVNTGVNEEVLIEQIMIDKNPIRLAKTYLKAIEKGKIKVSSTTLDILKSIARGVGMDKIKALLNSKSVGSGVGELVSSNKGLLGGILSGAQDWINMGAASIRSIDSVSELLPIADKVLLAAENKDTKYTYKDEELTIYDENTEKQGERQYRTNLGLAADEYMRQAGLDPADKSNAKLRKQLIKIADESGWLRGDKDTTKVNIRDLFKKISLDVLGTKQLHATSALVRQGYAIDSLNKDKYTSIFENDAYSAIEKDALFFKNAVANGDRTEIAMTVDFGDNYGIASDFLGSMSDKDYLAFKNLDPQARNKILKNYLKTNFEKYKGKNGLFKSIENLDENTLTISANKLDAQLSEALKRNVINPVDDQYLSEDQKTAKNAANIVKSTIDTTVVMVNGGTTTGNNMAVQVISVQSAQQQTNGNTAEAYNQIMHKDNQDFQKNLRLSTSLVNKNTTNPADGYGTGTIAF